MEKISVIVSCYNEEEALPLFYEEIVKAAKKMSKKVDFEFLFVMLIIIKIYLLLLFSSSKNDNI